MSRNVSLVYHGPQALIVELGTEVLDGYVVSVDADLAPKLLLAHGFSEASRSDITANEKRIAEEKKAAGEAPEPQTSDVSEPPPEEASV